MFCELTILLCFTESKIVCREGKDHTEAIHFTRFSHPSVLSVVLIFKDAVNNGQDFTWMDISYPAVALSPQNICVTQWFNETWNEGMAWKDRRTLVYKNVSQITSKNGRTECVVDSM